jgi:serine/threonine protein kinase
MDDFENLLYHQHGIEIKANLFASELESVHQAEYYNHNNYPCLVKVQWGDSMGATRREAEALRFLQHASLPWLCESFAFPLQGWNCHVLVTERLDFDLNSEIANRRLHAYPYNERDFCSAIYQLIDVFAYMEGQRYAHFAISPASIYFGPNKTIKIGNLAFVTSVPYQSVHPIQGDPHFYSPQLQQAVQSGLKEVKHNAYKSGVYALAVTLIGMSRLETKPVRPMEGWGAAVTALKWSNEVKCVLWWMLTEEEWERPSFVDIWKWITGLPPEMLLSMPIVAPKPVVSYALPPASEVTLPSSVPAQVESEPEESTMDKSKQEQPLSHQKALEEPRKELKEAKRCTLF